MKNVNYAEASSLIMEHLSHGGIFFSVKDKKGNINTMNTAWGGPAFYWNHNVYVAPIRHDRHTLKLLQDADSFTISVPLHGQLKKELLYVGTKHGYDEDKFAGCGLSHAPAKEVDSIIIDGCDLHVECRIKLVTEMDKTQMDKDTYDRCYGDGDMHVLYFGEVVACYRTDI